MTHMDELNKIVSKLVNLAGDGEYAAVAKANSIPATWRRRCEAISISARDGSWAREAKPEDIEVAKAIRDKLAEQYEEAGKIERATALLKIAAEIESLRVLLPSIAAKAAVELGERAREIKAAGS